MRWGSRSRDHDRQWNRAVESTPVPTADDEVRPARPTVRERMHGAPPWLLPYTSIVITRVAVAVGLGYAAYWSFVHLTNLVAMIALSLFFSMALEPGVSWLHEHRGMRRGAATGLMFAGIVAVFGVMIALLIPLTVELTQDVGTSIPHWVDQFNDWIDGVAQDSDLISDDASKQLSSQISNGVKNWFETSAGSAFSIATTGLSLVFNLLTVGLFTFYLTANAPKVRAAIAGRLPSEQQRRFLWTWDVAIKQTGGYFYSRVLLMMINGGLFFIVMTLVGTPVAYGIPLSLFCGFVAEFIPAIGTYIGAAIPLVFVLAEVGVAQAIIVLVWTIIYQQLENAWLSPRLSARTMSLNAGVAFGAALAGGALFGAIGAFVALPVAGMITALIGAYGRSYEVIEQSDASAARAAATGVGPAGDASAGDGGALGGAAPGTA